MANAILRPVYKLLFNRRIKNVLERIPFVRRAYAGWMRQHPFDVAHGTDTSGFVPVERIHSDPALNKLIIVYAGSQPSIVRRALSRLPDPQSYSLVDMGCGKGRATIVASEFPFKQITGVELSVELSAIAHENIASVQSRFSGRPPVAIVQGNAIQFPLPAGRVVIFMYHPFGRELMTQMVKAIEMHLQNGAEHVFVVYDNPVHGDLFDQSPFFKRWFADVLRYDESEVGFGPDLEETVIIWQSVRGAIPNPHAGADRALRIIKPLWTAGLGD